MLPDELRDARLRRVMTVAAAARFFDVCPATYKKWEAGLSHPRDHLAYLVTEFLNAPHTAAETVMARRPEEKPAAFQMDLFYGRG